MNRLHGVRRWHPASFNADRRCDMYLHGALTGMALGNALKYAGDKCSDRTGGQVSAYERNSM
jgi:hypothetical protein